MGFKKGKRGGGRRGLGSVGEFGALENSFMETSRKTGGPRGSHMLKRTVTLKTGKDKGKTVTIGTEVSHAAAYAGRVLRKHAKLAVTGGLEKQARLDAATKLYAARVIPSEDGVPKTTCLLRVTKKGKVMGFCRLAESGDVSDTSTSKFEDFEKNLKALPSISQAAAAGGWGATTTKDKLLAAGYKMAKYASPSTAKGAKSNVWSRLGTTKADALEAKRSLAAVSRKK